MIDDDEGVHNLVSLVDFMPVLLYDGFYRTRVLL